METIPSQHLPTKVKLCKKACTSCGLDIFQGPALERPRKSEVFWVGLSAVAFGEGQEKLPLSPLTASGALIHQIETPLRTRFSFYKTNLVKCAPLNNNKIRYPLANEMEKCYRNFEWELSYLQPKIVFLLGKQVSDFVMKKLGILKTGLNDDFIYKTVLVGGIRFVPIHHPSYILVYKRKSLAKYGISIQSIISESLRANQSAVSKKLS